MISEQRTNPAPAVYAAAVAILAFGVSWGMVGWGGITDDTTITVVLATAIVAVVSAAIAVAVTSEGSGIVVAFAAIGGAVIALDVALIAGLIIVISTVIAHIYTGVFIAVAYGVFGVSIIVAGFAYVGVIVVYRRLEQRFVHPLVSITAVIAVNAILISVTSALNASHPGSDLSLIVDRSIYSGIHDYIWMGVIVSIIWVVVILILYTIVLFVVQNCRRLLIDAGSEHMIVVTAIAIAIIATIVSVFFTVINTANTNTRYIDWYGEGLDLDAAVATGGVSIAGCAITAAVAGVVAWWYEALRKR